MLLICDYSLFIYEILGLLYKTNAKIEADEYQIFFLVGSCKIRAVFKFPVIKQKIQSKCSVFVSLIFFNRIVLNWSSSGVEW